MSSSTYSTPEGFDKTFIAQAIVTPLGIANNEGIGYFEFDFGRDTVDQTDLKDAGVFTITHQSRSFRVTVTATDEKAEEPT